MAVQTFPALNVIPKAFIQGSSLGIGNVVFVGSRARPVPNVEMAVFAPLKPSQAW